MCFVVYIDVLNVSMKFSVRLCIYEHIRNYVFATFLKIYLSKMTGMQNLIIFLKMLLRPWDLSHRVERQKLMIISLEEMYVRVRKGGFVANLLLR